MSSWLRNIPGWAVAAVLLAAAIFYLQSESALSASLILLAVAAFVGIRYWDTITDFSWKTIEEMAHGRIGALVIRDSYSPEPAADIFGDPTLVWKRREARAAVNSTTMEMLKQQSRTSGGSTVATSSLRFTLSFPGSLGASLPKLHGTQEEAQAKYKQSNADLANDIVRQLAAGDLVSKGSPVTGDVTRAERIIPGVSWSSLELDIRHAEASGSNARCIDVMVGKKPSFGMRGKSPPK